MLSKLNVGIICGGCSKEHEISLQSAMYIVKFIDRNCFDVVIFWINKNGNWYIIKNPYSSFSNYNNQNECISIFLLKDFSNKLDCRFNDFNNLLKLDVVFPIIHGELGEDGSLQGFLRVMNLPYVGADVLSSAVCMDKDITKRLLRDSGLPVVPFRTFLKHEQHSINFYNLVSVFGLPLIIKPANQGSSIGVSKVICKHIFNQALKIAFSYSSKIIIEPYIMGRELECAVLGNNNPESSVCGEIIVSDNNLYTYSDKYIKHNAQIVIPATIDNIISDRIRRISIDAFQILHCSGMARVDFFLIKNNQIFINEINTLPGFTNNSMYLKLWEVTGLTAKSLITKLIELALSRYYGYK